MQLDDSTRRLERLLAGAQHLAVSSGAPDDLILYTAQARLLALRRCGPPRRGRLRLALINLLVRLAWRAWDAAERLR